MNFKYKGIQVLFECDMDDGMNEFEMQSKGYLYGTVLKIKNGNQFQINFYDPTRLKQDADDELKTKSFFYEANVVLLQQITKEKVFAAIHDIISKEIYQKMIPLLP